MKNKFWLRKLAMGLVFVPLALFAFGSLVMYLWNAILPSVIHVTPITFWQALGILLLSKILFGGFRGGWGRPRRDHWKDRMQQKLSTMTPEEKEKFKQDWRNRCGNWGRPDREGFRQSRPADRTQSTNE